MASAPSSFFTTGAKVEVTSDEDGFRGAWFEATVVRTLPRVRRYTVEYESLLSSAPSNGGASAKRRLRETVDCRHVRPRPPPDRGPLGVDRAVGAYYNDAWWTGVLAKVVAGGGKRKGGGGGGGGERYTVCFPGTDEVIEFGEGEVRPHREWVGGEWIDPPQGRKENQQVEIGFSKGLKENWHQEMAFSKGLPVEVSSDEEGFLGSWFKAKIIEPRGKDMFLVEYSDLRTDDGMDLLREAVNVVHIRPTPPRTRVSSFKLLEEVDAWHNDGWWVGVVSKVLKGNRYMVYFKQSNEELEFVSHDLRLHFDWVRGKWVRASQVLGF